MAFRDEDYLVEINRKRTRRRGQQDQDCPYTWRILNLDNDCIKEGTSATIKEAQKSVLEFLHLQHGITITWRPAAYQPFLRTVAVLILLAFGPEARAESGIASDCEELMPHITAMDDWPVLKIFNPAKFAPFFTNTFRQDMNRRLAGLPTAYDYVLPPSERLLDCFGTARFKDGGQGHIQFWLDRDPDGEQFIGYKKISLGF